MAHIQHCLKHRKVIETRKLVTNLGLKSWIKPVIGPWETLTRKSGRWSRSKIRFYHLFDTISRLGKKPFNKWTVQRELKTSNSRLSSVSNCSAQALNGVCTVESFVLRDQQTQPKIYEPTGQEEKIFKPERAHWHHPKQHIILKFHSPEVWLARVWPAVQGKCAHNGWPLPPPRLPLILQTSQHWPRLNQNSHMLNK